MYVVFPAEQIVDQSYLASSAQASQTNIVPSHLLSYPTRSPPKGHSNDETLSPSVPIKSRRNNARAENRQHQTTLVNQLEANSVSINLKLTSIPSEPSALPEVTSISQLAAVARRINRSQAVKTLKLDRHLPYISKMDGTSTKPDPRPNSVSSSMVNLNGGSDGQRVRSVLRRGHSVDRYNNGANNNENVQMMMGRKSGTANSLQWRRCQRQQRQERGMTPLVLSMTGQDDVKDGRSPLIQNVHSDDGTDLTLDSPFERLIHPAVREEVRVQQQTSYKLIKILSEFGEELSAAKERHASDLQDIVNQFSTILSDTIPDSKSTLSIGTTSLQRVAQSMLASVELASQAENTTSTHLYRALSRSILERTLHVKTRTRETLQARIYLADYLAALDQRIVQIHEQYCATLCQYIQDRGRNDTQSVISGRRRLCRVHNEYVLQVVGVNATIDRYYDQVLPHMLNEIGDSYVQICSVARDLVRDTHIILATRRATNHSAQNENAVQNRQVATILDQIDPTLDLINFVSAMHHPTAVNVERHKYVPPHLPSDNENNITAHLINYDDWTSSDVVLDGDLWLDEEESGHDPLSSRLNQLDMELRRLADKHVELGQTIVSLDDLLIRSLQRQLFSNANTLQEDISRRMMEMRINELRLAACNAQRDVLTVKLYDGEPIPEEPRVVRYPKGGERPATSLPVLPSLKSVSRSEFAFDDQAGREDVARPVLDGRAGEAGQRGDQAHGGELSQPSSGPVSQSKNNNSKWLSAFKNIKTRTNSSNNTSNVRHNSESSISSQLVGQYPSISPSSNMAELERQQQQEQMICQNLSSYYPNGQRRSMSPTESHSRLISQANLRQPGCYPNANIGGSYSAATGSSSKIIDDLFGTNSDSAASDGEEQQTSGQCGSSTYGQPGGKPNRLRAGGSRPRLAEVAAALMKAKARGELPSALKSVSKENEEFHQRYVQSSSNNNNNNGNSGNSTSK